MTTQTIRDTAGFPVMVTAAFFVRNAGVISALLVLLFIAA